MCLGVDAAAPEGYEGAEDLSAVEAFLRSHGAVLVPEAAGETAGMSLVLDTKATKQRL